MDRRSYLRIMGASGAIGVTGLAGCVSTGGGGDDDTTEGDGNGDDDGTTTGGMDDEPRTITPGTAPGFAPFEMKQDGELVGFDVDLLGAVVEAADGVEMGEWQEFEFSSLIPALTSEKIDVIAAAMTINEERDQKIDFSDPYYSADQAILVREGGDFQPSELGDLTGNRVGAQEGTTAEGIIQDQLIDGGDMKQSSYTSYGSYVLAVQDLENRNLDAIMVDKPVADTFASQRNVEIAFVYETGEQYGFGVRTKDDSLQDALNEGLATVQDDGTYAEIRNKWFSGDDS
jgi:polar amino acid transport system substrate-binding protein